jgi:hypothetical protein
MYIFQKCRVGKCTGADCVLGQLVTDIWGTKTVSDSIIGVRAFPRLKFDKGGEIHTQRRHTWSMSGHTSSSLHLPTVGPLHPQMKCVFSSKPHSQILDLSGRGDRDDVSKPDPRINQRFLKEKEEKTEKILHL